MAWYLTWSCQIFCLLLLLLHYQCSAKLCSHDQSSALLQFKQLFSLKKLSASSACDKMVPSYPKLMSWKEDKDCCLWDGVTCDTVTGHVIELDLSCSWLYGSIPSNSSLTGHIPTPLSNLTALRMLNLSGNSLTGHIPTSLSNLTALELLDLSSNKFVGMIPMELESLNSLAVLNLSYNQLTGPIPHEKQFATFDEYSYIGNLGLCGRPLSKECADDEAPSPKPRSYVSDVDC